MMKIVRAMLFTGMAMLATSGATSEDQGFHAIAPSGMAAAAPDAALSVMTYNIKGLPWPVATGRSAALDRIAGRLSALRRMGQQPDVILLQEAFSDEAQALAARSGYPHVAFGPDALLRSPAQASASDGAYLRNARWDRGEAMGKSLGSGLIILSDHPIVATARMAFPDFACAGFDCLANKGVMIAHLAVPGAGRVSVVNTHLNARKAAGVAITRTQRAYARQVALMTGFIAAHVARGDRLIVGGDMNIGGDRQRTRTFFDGFAQARLPFVAASLGGAQQVAGREGTAPADLRTAIARRKDWLFARGAAGTDARTLGAQAPFGSEAHGPPLSDHVGYVVHYAMDDRPAAAPVRVAMAGAR